MTATMTTSTYRSDSLSFGAALRVVPSVRSHARSVLKRWGFAELSDDADSVVTELVENAVQATLRARLSEPVRLTLIGVPDAVLVIVHDAVADPPVPGTGFSGGFGPWAGGDSFDPDQHGNGLIIVAALSARWDWKHCPEGGKIVRAELRMPSLSLRQGHDRADSRGRSARS
jgi:anti-sigma regulatory factor (Ser/Thr protein kinase)